MADDEDNQQVLSVVLSIQIALLASSVALGRWLERSHCTWLGDAGAALLLGLAAGLLMQLVGLSPQYETQLVFKADIFLFVLLPAIMFDAAYSLDVSLFLDNVGSVCCLAFAGTTISAVVIGGSMWLAGNWGWCYAMPLLPNLVFGSLISATDPVTVLSVFNRLGADPGLYINVFGEAVLNDAVALVLYTIFLALVDSPQSTSPAAAIGWGVLRFATIFLGSVLVGLLFGCATALALRGDVFRDCKQAEVGLLVCGAYLSYLVPSCLGLSGITGIVCCGMVMNAFARPNMSAESDACARGLFNTLASLFDLFVFIYIGLTVNLHWEGSSSTVHYTLLCFMVLGVARAASVLPCCAAVNFLRPAGRRIPGRQQFMLLWSGLRGGMAFALSVQAAEVLGEAGQVIKTATFYIIFATVLVNGGATSLLLDRLQLRAASGGVPQGPPADAGDLYQEGGPNEMAEGEHDPLLKAASRQRMAAAGSLPRGAVGDVEEAGLLIDLTSPQCSAALSIDSPRAAAGEGARRRSAGTSPTSLRRARLDPAGNVRQDAQEAGLGAAAAGAGLLSRAVTRVREANRADSLSHSLRGLADAARRVMVSSRPRPAAGAAVAAAVAEAAAAAAWAAGPATAAASQPNGGGGRSLRPDGVECRQWPPDGHQPPGSAMGAAPSVGAALGRVYSLPEGLAVSSVPLVLRQSNGAPT